MSELVSAFNKYFEIVTADTPALKEQALRLRYEVYVQELQFFSGEHGLETDGYDAYAIHGLMYHRPTGVLAGTVRLILSDPDRADAPFPAEKFIGELPPLGPNHPTTVARRQIAEVSRFTLARRFRSRRGESVNPYGAPQDTTSSALAPGLDNAEKPLGSRRHGEEQRVLLHPLLGLFLWFIRTSAECKLAYWYVFIERSLDRLLRRFGLCFEPFGPEVEYLGFRRVCIAKIPDFLRRLRAQQPDVWALLTDQGNSSRALDLTLTNSRGP